MQTIEAKLSATASDSFTIREATPADAPTIIAQRRAMFEGMGYVNRAELDLTDDDFAEWIQNKLASEEYHGWLLTNASNAVVAGAGIWMMNWPPHPQDRHTRRAAIMNVYTEPEYRHLGLTRRLFTHILDWCRENGIRTVTAQAIDINRQLYDALGFRPTGEVLIRLSVPN
jgi:GNAT superfamily N-acetyltransferase